jgi:hypothetical protein
MRSGGAPWIAAIFSAKSVGAHASAVGGLVCHAPTRARPTRNPEGQRRDVRAVSMAPRTFHHMGAIV